MFKKSETTGEFYTEALFESETVFDELKQKQIIEEDQNPNIKLLVSQTSIIEKAKIFNKQRSEYKNRVTKYKSISIDSDVNLETNKSNNSNDSKLNSSLINKYKKRENFKEAKNHKISFDQTNNLSCVKVSLNTMSTLNNNNNNGQYSTQKHNFAVTNAFHKKIKNPLLFDSDEFVHKYDLVNIIPKNSILKVDEQKFISRGDVKKYIASKKNMRKSQKSCDKILTPFQKNENCKNILKEKLIINQEILGEKAALFKRSYDNLKKIDPDELQHPASTCTIFNFNSNKNSKKNFKEILLTKLTKDNLIVDMANTTKEILPNIGYQCRSTTGFGFLSDKKKGNKNDLFADVNYMSRLLSHTKSDFGRMQNSSFNHSKRQILVDKNFKKQDTYYNDFKNYKLENKDKLKNDQDPTYKQNNFAASNPNNLENDGKPIGFTYGIETFGSDQNSQIKRPKYSNPDGSEKKRINLLINKISSSSNDINLNENTNYKTSTNFYKNIKSNSGTDNNFNFSAQEEKTNAPNSGKNHSPRIFDNLNDKNKNYKIEESNLNLDNSACQTVENQEDKNEALIKSNKNSKINLNNYNNNNQYKTIANKNNLNSFNNTYNTKFSKPNYNINLFNYGNKNRKMNEIYTSTENEEKLYSEATSDEKFLKIDYDKPAKSTNDILSYIIKTNTMQLKKIDPLLNNQRFFIHSQQNFANINNKFFQESKNSFYKKGMKNFDVNLKNNSNFNMKRNQNNRMVNNSNHNVNDSKEKCNITTTNLNESFTYNCNYNNGYEDIPIPSIFKARSTSYFTKFYKRNKF